MPFNYVWLYGNGLPLYVDVWAAFGCLPIRFSRLVRSNDMICLLELGFVIRFWPIRRAGAINRHVCRSTWCQPGVNLGCNAFVCATSDLVDQVVTVVDLGCNLSVCARAT